MGLRGTDVAREAAAMILLDDAFPTIVKAIREGRVIFGNIRRFAAYLLACNLTEVLVIGLAVLSTIPLPILPFADSLPQPCNRCIPGLCARNGRRRERYPQATATRSKGTDPRALAMGDPGASQPGDVCRHLRRTCGGTPMAGLGRPRGRDRHVPDAGVRAALAGFQHAPSAFGCGAQRSHPQSVGMGIAALVHRSPDRAALCRPYCPRASSRIGYAADVGSRSSA